LIGTIASILARHATRLGLPYALVPHADYILELRKVRTVRMLLKRAALLCCARGVIESARVVIVATRLEGERIRRIAPCLRATRIIPNLSVRSPSLASPDLNADDAEKPVALWLGRISSEKGLDLLIDIWPVVRHHVPSARLVLGGSVGDGKLARSLKARVARLALQDSIEFRSSLRGAETAAITARARCFVLPSHYESFGRVVVEALEQGTPVVMSTATPWESLLAEAGFCLSLDQRTWAEAVVHYLAPRSKRAVPEWAREAVLSPYSFGVVAAAWQRVLDELRPLSARLGDAIR